MSVLSIDFETRSPVELKKTGVYPYATDPHTDIWCMAYAFDDEPVELWTPGVSLRRMCDGKIHPDALAPDSAGAHRVWRHIQSGGEMRAWNAGFERLIWACILHPRYGFPLPTRDQWFDTAADAAALGLPRALNRAALALGLDQEKDDDGYRLMRQMSQPVDYDENGEPIWWDASRTEDFERLYAYCRQDVRVERAVLSRVRKLSERERKVYILTEKINDRGIGIDLELVSAAQQLVELGTERANEELAQLTDGEVEKFTQVQRLTEWLNHQVDFEIDNLRKDTLRDLLDGDVEMPDDVLRAMEIRRGSAKSSNAKLDSMTRYASFDGRAHGMLVYHGASTGRWSGRGPQPHNFPRPEIDDIEKYIPLVKAVHDGHSPTKVYDALEKVSEEPALVVISSALRSCFRAAPGHRFLNGDFSQIEARALAWLAEEEYLVKLFASGGKVYEDMASFIYGIPVEEIAKDSVERQIGKNSILGAGFQMGWKTFQEQVKKQTGIDLSDEDAKRAINRGYRVKNQNIVGFWSVVDEAAMDAVRNPGKVVTCGRRDMIKFVVRAQFLWCILPSGRPLAYALPSIRKHLVRPKDPDVDPFETLSVAFMGVDSYTKKWKRQYMYGGRWTENIVQAIARDLIAFAMLRLEDAGYPQVLTVHDEAMAEVPNGQGSLDEFLDIMRIRPDWAHDLPIEVEGWEGERYRK